MRALPTLPCAWDENLMADESEDVCGGVLKAFREHCAGRRVMVLEDDPIAAAAMQTSLTQAGCGQVVWLTNGVAAVEAAASQPFDLLILDRNTPGIDGRQTLERIRQHEADTGRAPTPAMFLTALGIDRQRIEGLMAGADDYLVKPVSDLELLARAAALMRRSAWSPASDVANDRLVNGPLTLRPSAMEALLAGRPLKLTGREMSILTLLAQNLGAPVTRAMIWDRCWPEYNFQPEEFENRIDVHASRLRRRLDIAAEEAGATVIAPSARPLIVSIRNQGLMLRNLREAL